MIVMQEEKEGTGPGQWPVDREVRRSQCSNYRPGATNLASAT